MTARNLADLTRTIHAAFCEGALERCLEVAAGDIEVVFQPTGQIAHGREGFLQFMQGFRTAFPDIHIRHTNLLQDGDRVAVEFEWTGTHTGPLMTPAGALPPTGKSVTRGRVAEFWHYREGKLVRLVNYQDFGDVLRQLGLI